MRLVTLATCNLNQWALDFQGNSERIIQSIIEAKKQGALYRVGPELEVTGYSCEDHFYERDTFQHSWEVLLTILTHKECQDIVLDIGMPVKYKDATYNCRIFAYNMKIYLIRPKMTLAQDGNYREQRWFSPWNKIGETENFFLPLIISNFTGQQTCAFGDGIISFKDTFLAPETCEELFTPISSHISLGLAGVEIFSNGSGSHHQLRKLNQRIDLIKNATKKSGGIYLYANHCGCDGNRLYFDGCCMIAINGEIVAQGSQFSILDVEVVTATVDLENVRTFRGSIGSRNIQSSSKEQTNYPIISIPLRLTKDVEEFNFMTEQMIDNSKNNNNNNNEDNEEDLLKKKNLTRLSNIEISTPIQPKIYSVEEEICYGPACWLWDYLRRSGLNGFFLPLSGGIDSSSTASIVGAMCQRVARLSQEGNKQVIKDARRIVGEDPDGDYLPTDPKEFAQRMFFTCYMGTENSSIETKYRAEQLAGNIGSYHLSINIDGVIGALLTLFTSVFKKEPKFKVHGGTNAENLALQNIQARTRMVLSYFFSGLFCWLNGRNGNLLVLGSANVDEALRGYFTKYDCSSADINPIGGICKQDLRDFIVWATTNLDYPILNEIYSAPPTAELEPVTDEYSQTDEEDMSMSYSELKIYGSLRKLQNCGPVSMFQKLLFTWKHLSPSEIASKVKRFFFFYGINRHKMCTITPSYHAENYSPDDNRFDLRPFLYPRWNWQFKRIDTMVQAINNRNKSVSSL